MKEIILTTDGACIGNPGPGGWACLLRYNGHSRELFGSEAETTNNRMELRAVIEGLRALKEPCAVTVRTDSQYLKNGITDWIHRWKSQAWLHKVKGQGKQPVKNRDLWEEMERQAQRHELRWEWVRGHAADQDNNRCDFLANSAARAVSNQLNPA
jgi:ribonuclease HI